MEEKRKQEQMSYYKTKESVDEYIRLAEGFDGKALIKQLLEHVQGHTTVLELGSGPGKDWQILQETFQVTGSDSSPEFVKRLKAQYLAGDFVELDASKLLIDKKFDIIFSNKVMHHLNDDEMAHSFQKQFELLNDQGIICHSFWKGQGTEVFKGLYVNYVLKNDLETLMKRWFEPLVLQEYAEFEDNDSLLLIARKV